MSTSRPPDADALAAVGLRLDLQDAVATVTLAKPERRNSMTPGMWFALADIGATLPASVRAVVVRGEGECFSAGLDRAMLTPDGPPGEPGFADLVARDDAGMLAEIGRYQEGFTWLARPDLFTVAAVHGYAIGGGFQLALACDVRVVADDVAFSMKEPALGIVPDLAGTKPLVDAVGYARAVEICATARYVGAEEAVRVGLAVSSVAADRLDAAVDDLVQAVLANPTDAVRETKRLLQGAGARTLEEQRLAERTAQVPLLRRLADG